MWLRIGLLLVLLSASACAGRISGGEPYRDPQGRFIVGPIPAPWQPADLKGATLAARLPAQHAGMGLGVNCESPEPGLLPAVARHLFFGLRDQRIQSREPVVLAGVAGLRTRLTASFEGVPVEVDALTLRHQGCLYDFLYAAPPASFAQGQKGFEALLASWRPSDQTQAAGKRAP